MPSSVASVSTPNASRYLKQLCTHFGHQVPVDFNDQVGRVTLPFGVCIMQAETDRLTLNAHSEFAELPRLERIIGEHLARFAFRENPGITWQRAA